VYHHVGLKGRVSRTISRRFTTAPTRRRRHCVMHQLRQHVVVFGPVIVLLSGCATSEHGETVRPRIFESLLCASSPQWTAARRIRPVEGSQFDADDEGASWIFIARAGSRKPETQRKFRRDRPGRVVRIRAMEREVPQGQNTPFADLAASPLVGLTKLKSPQPRSASF
jgi:hypothetical protein